MWDGDPEEAIDADAESSGSKPTVWDGDKSVLLSRKMGHLVLSPPCGMETDVKFFCSLLILLR